MNEKNDICPICENDDFSYLGCECTKQFDNTDRRYNFDCAVCGKFSFTEEALNDFEFTIQGNENIFPRGQRSIISHLIKKCTRGRRDTVLLDCNFTKENYRKMFSATGRPCIDEQMNEIINCIGREFDKTGERMNTFPIDFHSIVGSLSRIKAVELATELKNRGYIDFVPINMGGRWEPKSISLTYEGSVLYSEQRK